MSEVAAAYSASGAAWQAGPGAIYERLAEVVVGHAPVPLRGRLVLDVGAGTGAASRAIVRAGGVPIALDVAAGMVSLARGTARVVVADALALPVWSARVGGVVAAFSISHVPDAAAALREARRVTAPGGPIVASVLAADDAHPAKDAVAAALRCYGWREPGWDGALRALGTPERCVAVARAAGLDAVVHEARVLFPVLGAADLVAWRLGLPQAAPFVAGLQPAARADLARDALCRLGDAWPPLVRSILVIAAVA